LAPSTLAEKARLGYPSDILVRTGELRDSLTDPGRAMKIGATEATYGTDVFYAGYHQDGTTKMPQRQVIPLPLPPSLRQRLETAMVFWVDLVAARTFGRI
jgi:phage gpG-like protein